MADPEVLDLPVDPKNRREILSSSHPTSPGEQVAATASGAGTDESGTAPGDRRFRPDIEGLRAVAVLLVVLYHAHLPGLRGGFVGVDVFFVISGFVITGLLLRERSSTERTSLAHFYSRRIRRILPAATLVVVVTVVATYVVLGSLVGNPTAVDARWTSVFLANFHLASVGTDYLHATQPPSPLQNFWSLAVEEQFYLVFPGLFLLVASLRSSVPLRVRLAFALLPIIVMSLLLSIVQTTGSPAAAFFSPFTRAWELALGALVAVGTPALLRLPSRLAAVVTWVGLGAIVLSACWYSDATPYPGIAVALPVLGSALVIAGGTSHPVGGAELVLGWAPAQWTGRLSYSLYLWHWPILILAAEAAGQRGLPFTQNLVWLGLAVAASIASYYLVEQPVRHARALVGRHVRTAVLGILLIVISLVVATVALKTQSATATGVSRTHGASLISWSPEKLAAELRAAPQITQIPANLLPPLAETRSNWPGPPKECSPTFGATSEPACVYGDVHASHTLVLYGDSHAWMWFAAMNLIGLVAHWQVVVLGKGDCPAADLAFVNPGGWGSPGGRFTACDSFHQFAMTRIAQIHPDLVVVSQNPDFGPRFQRYSPTVWQEGLTRAIHALPVRPDQIVVVGNIPQFPGAGPDCLNLHRNDVQACSGTNSSYVVSHNEAEKRAAVATGASYVDTTPWFCSTICTDIVGQFQPYWDGFHVTADYSIAVSRMLADSLALGVRAVPTASPGAGG